LQELEDQAVPLALVERTEQGVAQEAGQAGQVERLELAEVAAHRRQVGPLVFQSEMMGPERPHS